MLRFAPATSITFADVVQRFAIPAAVVSPLCCANRPAYALLFHGADVLSSPTPPVAMAGDFNDDTKVNFIDLSTMFSNFGKTTGYPAAVDMNKDGVVNTTDFALLKNILISNGVLR